jgi:hypothetical protein
VASPSSVGEAFQLIPNRAETKGTRNAYEWAQHRKGRKPHRPIRFEPNPVQPRQAAFVPRPIKGDDSPVEFSEPLKDTDDGLRGFELKDADGSVLLFGRPRS